MLVSVYSLVLACLVFFFSFSWDRTGTWEDLEITLYNPEKAACLVS